MIKVVLADDHQMFLDGLVLLLKDVEDIECVGTANDGIAAKKLIEESHVDVALLDIGMPQLNGIELTRLLAEESPEVKVVILSMHKDKRPIAGALEAGAHGYIIKEEGRGELVNAIREVYHGREYYSTSVTQTIMSSLRKATRSSSEVAHESLTKRELDVLRLIVEGHSTPEIAEKLFVAKSTVASHRKNIHSKLGINNVNQLITYTLKHGLLDNGQ